MSRKAIKNIEMLIFDLDGVVTSEEIYWYDAGLTVYEIVEEKMFLKKGFKTHNFDSLIRKSEEYLPKNLIMQLRSRGITSNWDLAYVVSCLYIIGALKLVGMKEGRENLTALIGKKEEWSFLEIFEYFGAKLEFIELKEFTRHLISLFLANTTDMRGFEVMDYLNNFFEDLTGVKAHLLQRGDNFWLLCRKIFQEWHFGDGNEWHNKNYGAELKQKCKSGLIHHEKALFPIEHIRSTLEALKSLNIRLGIATGRPYEEAIEFLNLKGLIHFFEKEHIATYREVENAEEMLFRKGIQVQLSKPKPFSFLKAIYPNIDILRLYNGAYPKKHEDIGIVTDATGDIIAGKEIGCVTIGVLSGIEKEEALKDAGCDVIIKDMTYLPVLFKKSFLEG